MQKFQPASYPESAFDPAWYMQHGATQEQAERAAEDAKLDTVFINDIYQVAVSDAEIRATGFPAMWHLSIKRRDRRVIRDWRILQEIKNAIVGPDHEGVELFPADDRLVDTVNQYHLWVFKEPWARMPFGFTVRAVQGPGEGIQLPNIKQRELKLGAQ